MAMLMKKKRKLVWWFPDGRWKCSPDGPGDSHDDSWWYHGVQVYLFNLLSKLKFKFSLERFALESFLLCRIHTFVLIYSKSIALSSITSISIKNSLLMLFSCNENFSISIMKKKKIIGTLKNQIIFCFWIVGHWRRRIWG